MEESRREVFTEFLDGYCVPSDKEKGLVALLLGLFPTHIFWREGSTQVSETDFYKFSHLSEMFCMKNLDCLYLDTNRVFTVIKYKL